MALNAIVTLTGKNTHSIRFNKAIKNGQNIVEVIKSAIATFGAEKVYNDLAKTTFVCDLSDTKIKGDNDFFYIDGIGNALKRDEFDADCSNDNADFKIELHEDGTIRNI